MFLPHQCHSQVTFEISLIHISLSFDTLHNDCLPDEHQVRSFFTCEKVSEGVSFFTCVTTCLWLQPCWKEAHRSEAGMEYVYIIIILVFMGCPGSFRPSLG